MYFGKLKKGQAPGTGHPQERTVIYEEPCTALDSGDKCMSQENQTLVPGRLWRQFGMHLNTLEICKSLGGRRTMWLPVPTTISDTLVSGLRGMSAHHLAVAAPADIAVSRNHDVLLVPYFFSSCAPHVACSESVTCPGGHLYVCPFRCVTAVHNTYHIPPAPSKITLAFFCCSLTPFFSQTSLGL